MEKNIIGFWGYPDQEIINKTKNEYPDAHWVDLDVDFLYQRTHILPESYCKIIKNIINNAMHFKERLIKIIAPNGNDKCDSGWFAAAVLKDLGLCVETSGFEKNEIKYEQLICESDISLKQKFEMITGSIVNKTDKSMLKKSKPKFGFWGVPPNDLFIFEVFPNETHIYGWTRCLEAGCPANLELEMYVEPDVPTVFYSQSYCSKSFLAKYLADKYNGLYINVDDYASDLTKTKIKAFLKTR